MYLPLQPPLRCTFLYLPKPDSLHPTLTILVLLPNVLLLIYQTPFHNKQSNLNLTIPLIGQVL